MAIELSPHSKKVIDKELSKIIRSIDRTSPISRTNVLDLDSILNQILADYNKTTGTGKERKVNSVIYRIDTYVLVFYDRDDFGIELKNIRFNLEQEADQVIAEFLKKRLKDIEGILAKKAVDSGKVYGDVIFGTSRGLFEPDTYPEEKLFNKVKKYIDDNVHFDQQTKNDLSQILNSREYTDVFSPPKSGTKIYRGMTITKPELEKLLTPEEILTLETNKKPNSKTFTVPFVFKPKNEISSWSKDQHVAKNFSSDNLSIKQRKIYSIILVSTITESDVVNFLDVKGWYDEIGGYEAEQEVIAFDNVTVTEVQYSLAYPGIQI